MQQPQEFKNDVWSRFNVLLSGGVLSPLEGTGLIEETIKRISEEGYYPSDEFLGKMGMLTNASTHWLMTGQDTPLITNNFEYDGDAAIYLDDLLAEDFTLYLVCSGNDWLIVGTLPIWVDVRCNLKHSHRVEIITGDLGLITRNRLQEASKTHRVFQMKFSNEKFEQLRTGQIAFKCETD